MGLQAIQTGLVDEDSVFLSFASDGKDNSDASGAIVDKYTIEKAKNWDWIPRIIWQDLTLIIFSKNQAIL